MKRTDRVPREAQWAAHAAIIRLIDLLQEAAAANKMSRGKLRRALNYKTRSGVTEILRGRPRTAKGRNIGPICHLLWALGYTLDFRLVKIGQPGDDIVVGSGRVDPEDPSATEEEVDHTNSA